MELLQDMSKCSSETRQAIAEEIVSSMGTNEFIARETEAGEECNKWYATQSNEKPDKNWDREGAQKLVADARKMLIDITEALQRKSS